MLNINITFPVLFLSLFLNVFLQITLIDATAIISACLGYNHGCAILGNKKMKCWGLKTSFGEGSIPGDVFGDVESEIGDGLPYVNVSNSIGVDKVSCGVIHICMKLETGYIKCMGDNLEGQIGLGSGGSIIGAINGYIGDNLPVVNIGTNLIVFDIALGNQHSCAKVTGNKVKCFGSNTMGQLGLGDRIPRGRLSSHMGDNLPFIDFGTDVEVASIHSGQGANHNCVILSAPADSSQRVKCWGQNYYNELGYGNLNPLGDSIGEMGDNLTLINFGTESKVKQLAVGTRHTCFLLLNDILKCTGFNSYGQLASGSSSTILSTGNSIPSVLIDSGKTIKLITTGYFHTCIVYDDNISMKCTGLNSYGQLGQGDTIGRGYSPTTTFPSIPVIDLGTGSLTISSVLCSNFVTCVIFSDSSIKCFGYNQFAQLLIGSKVNVGDNAGEMGTNLQFSQLLSPTQSPTKDPTQNPTEFPTNIPTKVPTNTPTKTPTQSPIKPPTPPTSSPTNPTRIPSKTPSKTPTRTPTPPTNSPISPTLPTSIPTKTPTRKPSKNPQKSPTVAPTPTPTRKPTKNPVRSPTTKPTSVPTRKPSKSPVSLCSYTNKKKCKNDPLCNWSNGTCTRL